MTTSIPLRIYLNTILSPAAEKPSQKNLRIWGEFVGRTTKRFYSIVPQKPATYKGFRGGDYRIATRISSQPRYDRFDTSPYWPLLTTGILYQQVPEKSRVFLPFCKLQNLLHPLTDCSVVFPPVRPQTPGAILDSLVRIPEAAPALLPQSVQWAVAEQAAETLRVRPLVTRKILTFPVLKKIVMAHSSSNPRPKPDSGVNCCLRLRAQKTLSLRASAHTGVAIPRLNGSRSRLPPKMWQFPDP